MKFHLFSLLEQQTCQDVEVTVSKGFYIFHGKSGIGMWPECHLLVTE
jgi:hypothetical protein